MSREPPKVDRGIFQTLQPKVHPLHELFPPTSAAYPASFSPADDAVTDENRDSSDDVAEKVIESALPPQAVICNKSSALHSRASIFLTLVIFLLAGISMPAAAKVLIPCDTGLVNDGFRHRDLHTATFLTRDPAGFIDGPNTYNYVGHNPWSAFDPHGLATSLQIPTGTADIGYVGDTSVSWHDPPMISYGPNRDSGTAGSQHPYGYSPGGGPGVTVDPVSDAVGSQPSSLLDNALDAYAWVREISRGYSFGYDYLGGVMGAGYPEDTVPPHPGPYREPQPGTFAYFQDKIWDFTLFFAELPGKTVAAAITLGGATDITTGTEITYDLEYGYGMSEVTPGSRWVAGALIAIPFRAGSYVDDGIRIATSKSPSTTLRIGSKLETRTGTEMAEEVANSTPVKYIGRMDDLKGIPRGQTLLDDLPYQGSPRADYYQNSSVLRKALRDGYEIRDASAIRPNWEPAPTPDWPTRTVGQTFTGAERLILDNKGLKLSPSGAYVPK